MSICDLEQRALPEKSASEVMARPHSPIHGVKPTRGRGAKADPETTLWGVLSGH